MTCTSGERPTRSPDADYRIESAVPSCLALFVRTPVPPVEFSETDAQMVDTLNAHALSPKAAYVVRKGDYTIDVKDGRPATLRLIMTTIRERPDEGWRISQLYESYAPAA